MYCPCAQGNGSVLVFAHGSSRCPVYRFDAAFESFTELSALPVRAWSCFDVAVLGPHVFVVGGAVEGEWSKLCYRYDVLTNSWTRLPDMRLPRRRCAAVVI